MRDWLVGQAGGTQRDKPLHSHHEEQACFCSSVSSWSDVAVFDSFNGYVCTGGQALRSAECNMEKCMLQRATPSASCRRR